MAKKKATVYTNDEKIRIAEAILSLGLAELPGITGKAAVKQAVDKVLSTVKLSNGGVEVKEWSDKKGDLFITMTKLLEDGTRTKGFGVPKGDFKSFVSSLNSVLDKMA